MTPRRTSFSSMNLSTSPGAIMMAAAHQQHQHQQQHHRKQPQQQQQELVIGSSAGGGSGILGESSSGSSSSKAVSSSTTDTSKKKVKNAAASSSAEAVTSGGGSRPLRDEQRQGRSRREAVEEDQEDAKTAATTTSSSRRPPSTISSSDRDAALATAGSGSSSAPNPIASSTSAAAAAIEGSKVPLLTSNRSSGKSSGYGAIGPAAKSPPSVSASSSDDAEGSSDSDSDYQQVELDPSFWAAIKYLIASSSPMIVGFILEGLLQLVSTAVVGRLGPLELAIVGQGNQLIGVTGSIIVLSSTSAQMTLSAPLFTSRTSSATSVGVVAQRAFLLALVSSIPVVWIWSDIERIFLALGQPASLSHGLASYMRWALISIPGYALMEVAKAYLQAQGIFHPPTLIAALVLPIHTALTYLLVFHTSLRQDGAAVALACSEWLIGLGLIAWISWTSSKECWGGLDARAFKEWGQFLGMLVPAIFMFGSEWWSFEIVSLFAGRLGELDVAAQAAVTSLDMVLALIPVAGAVSSLSRIGNLLGYGPRAIQTAKTSVRATYLVMTSYGILIAATMIIFRDPVSRIFTDDEPTIELMKEVLIPMAIYQIWDALQGVGGSILRALAKQHIVAGIHLVAYYVLAIPLGWWLAFNRGWGLPGLWAGLSFGLLFVSVVELGIYFGLVDWEVEMERNEERTSKVVE